MASIKLQGDTSGELTISAPAVAGTNTLTLPAASGNILTDGAVANNGIYLGGTASANLLNDYEEGEWTPTDASGAGLSFTLNNDNWYVKVGNLVTVSFDFTFPSTSSTAQAEINLPFVMNANNTAGGIINWSNSGSNDTIHAFPNKMIFMYNGNSSRTNINYSGDRIIGAFTYQTT